MEQMKVLVVGLGLIGGSTVSMAPGRKSGMRAPKNALADRGCRHTIIKSNS